MPLRSADRELLNFYGLVVIVSLPFVFVGYHDGGLEGIRWIIHVTYHMGKLHHPASAETVKNIIAYECHG
jgi:hypothetical protein